MYLPLLKKMLKKKMLWVGPVPYFLSIMPIAITYQAFSMYQALRKAL